MRGDAVRAAYGKSQCPVCNKPITNAGAARTAHCRAHVRRGDATERYSRELGGIVFEKVRKQATP